MTYVKQREFYLPPDTHWDAIPMVGVSRNSSSHTAFAAHRHTCHEICVVTGGSIDYFTEQEQYTLGPGSIQVSQPGEYHGLPNDQLHPCRLYWIHVKASKLRSRQLVARLNELPNYLATGGLDLAPHFEAILEHCRHPSPHAALEQQAALWQLLATLIRLAETQTQQCVPTTLRRALEIIDAHPEGELTVAELADRLNTHRSHLHRLFAHHLGVSTQAYLKEQRIRRAATLLRDTDRSITDIAYALGFAATQHFATTFKARYGLTPTNYRQRSFV